MEISISQLIRILPAQYLRTLSTAVGRALSDEIAHDVNRPATADDFNRIGDELWKMSTEVCRPVDESGFGDVFSSDETPAQKGDRQMCELRNINEAAEALRSAYLTITQVS